MKNLEHSSCSFIELSVSHMNSDLDLESPMFQSTLCSDTRVTFPITQFTSKVAASNFSFRGQKLCQNGEGEFSDVIYQTID